jgi:polyhydroxybutyrate depolymerase
MKYLLLLFFFISSTLQADSPKLVYKFLTLGNQKRDWWEYVPISCSNKECPLVFAFTGGESSADRLDDDVKLTSVSEKNEFIIVFPNAVNKQWADGRSETATNLEDLSFFDKLIEEMRKLHKVDGNKIFATGLADGGLFAFKLACDRSEVIAAIAPVAANMASELVDKCNPTRAVPIINFVGTEDKFIPMNGGDVKGKLGLKKKGTVLSTNQTVAFWIKRNKCSEKPNVDKVRDQNKNDKTYAILEKYENCESGADIFRWIIGEGGHTWPSGFQKSKLLGKVSFDVNASEEIWNFFSKHPMKDSPPSNVQTPSTPPPSNPVLR